ncbi:MAG: hypothetical protein HDS69_00545 [Bacteroidales bacterium]|nr:hypothetical protein [Bacteroidales bacterium]
MAISLKIKGNKRTNEGIGNDLVSIGDNRFPVNDAQYPGTKGFTDFIVIRHLPDKSIYTVVTKNVTPCDSNREGTLYVSVAVPVKEHVKGLFNLLIELQNAYKSTCMNYDGTMYHFLSRNDSPQPFEEIMASHPVERYPFKPVVTSDDLSAKAYLFMSPEQISDLLDDPMRGEFSRFGEVVLVPVADPSQYVSTINIPAKIWRSYKIFVNGRQTGQVLSDPTKVVTITLPETSTHKSASVTFSIAGARETRVPGIAIDDEAQIIYLNIKPEAKPAPIVHESITSGDKPNKKKSNTMTIALIAGVAVIAIAAAAYFFLLSPKSAEQPLNPGILLPVDSAPNVVPPLPTDSLSKQSTDTLPADTAIPTDPTDPKVSNDPEDAKNAKDTKNSNPPKAADTKDPKLNFEADLTKINSAEAQSFRTIKELYRNRTNHTEHTDYKSYNDKVEFVNGVVKYIESLKNGNIKPDEYKKKISAFAQKAKALGLNKLGEKLGERIKNPAKINESIKESKKF